WQAAPRKAKVHSRPQSMARPGRREAAHPRRRGTRRHANRCLEHKLRGADEAIMTVTVPAAANAPSQASVAVIATDIPARLDRLRWGRFHTLVVVALGITWILDGLEVTLAGAISPALKESPQLQFSNADVGLASSAYLAGAVLGALFFGWLTDRL